MYVFPMLVVDVMYNVWFKTKGGWTIQSLTLIDDILLSETTA